MPFQSNLSLNSDDLMNPTPYNVIENEEKDIIKDNSEYSKLVQKYIQNQNKENDTKENTEDYKIKQNQTDHTQDISISVSSWEKSENYFIKETPINPRINYNIQKTIPYSESDEIQRIKERYFKKPLADVVVKKENNSRTKINLNLSLIHI